MSQPRPQSGARHRAYAAASPASPGKLGVWRNPLYAKLNEDAGENSAAASSKGRIFLSGVRWEIGEAQSVVFLPPVLASGFV